MRRAWAVALAAAVALSLAVGLAAGAVPLAPGDVWRGLIGADPCRRHHRPRAARAAGAARLPGGRQPRRLRRGAPGHDPQPPRRAVPAGPLGRCGPGRRLALASGSGGPWSVPVAAFLGALAAIALVYRLTLVAGRRLDPRVLLLAGVVVGAFAGALMSAIIVLADTAAVRNAFLWLLGGFGGASWQALAVFAAYAVLPLGVICLERARSRPARPGRGAGAPPRRGSGSHPAAGLRVHGAADRGQRGHLRHHRLRRPGRPPRGAHRGPAAPPRAASRWRSWSAAASSFSPTWSRARWCARSSSRSA